MRSRFVQDQSQLLSQVKHHCQTPINQHLTNISLNLEYCIICLLCHFQSMFDYLDNAVIKLCEMSTVGTDLGTVKQQIEELKVGFFTF